MLSERKGPANMPLPCHVKLWSQLTLCFQLREAAFGVHPRTFDHSFAPASIANF